MYTKVPNNRGVLIPCSWVKYLFFPLAVKNVQTKVAPTLEVVLKVLVFAVHVRELKKSFLGSDLSLFE